MDALEREVLDRLTRIETKLDQGISLIDDHERRIRALEQWRYAVPASVFAALASLIAVLVR